MHRFIERLKSEVDSSFGFVSPNHLFGYSILVVAVDKLDPILGVVALAFAQAVEWVDPMHSVVVLVLPFA